MNDHTYDSYKEALTYLLFVYFMAEEKIDIAIITLRRIRFPKLKHFPMKVIIA